MTMSEYINANRKPGEGLRDCVARLRQTPGWAAACGDSAQVADDRAEVRKGIQRVNRVLNQYFFGKH